MLRPEECHRFEWPAAFRLARLTLHSILVSVAGDDLLDHRLVFVGVDLHFVDPEARGLRLKALIGASERPRWHDTGRLGTDHESYLCSLQPEQSLCSGRCEIRFAHPIWHSNLRSAVRRQRCGWLSAVRAKHCSWMCYGAFWLCGMVEPFLSIHRKKRHKKSQNSLPFVDIPWSGFR